MRGTFILSKSQYEKLLKNGEIYNGIIPEQSKIYDLMEVYSSVLRVKTDWAIPFNVPYIGYLKDNMHKVHKSPCNKQFKEYTTDVIVHCRIPSHYCITVNTDILLDLIKLVEINGNTNILSKDVYKDKLRASRIYDCNEVSNEVTMTPFLKKEWIARVEL